MTLVGRERRECFYCVVLKWDKGGKEEQVSRLRMEQVSKPNGATKEGQGGR
jgi:hypothetical protein